MTTVVESPGSDSKGGGFSGAALGRRPEPSYKERAPSEEQALPRSNGLVLAACAGVLLVSGRWFSFPVPACSCLCFGLSSFL